MPDDIDRLGGSPATRFITPHRSDAPPSESAALAQLRAFIADQGFQPGARLPPERELCAALGLRRYDLRKALATLERENRLWRHVGKGTFLASDAGTEAPNGFDHVAQQFSPADVMRARRAGTCNRARGGDARLCRRKRQVAEAGGSTTLPALFDQLITLRRIMSWGRIMRDSARPPDDHGSFDEHARIVEGIAERAPDAAQ